MLITQGDHRFEISQNHGESLAAWGDRLGGAVAWCVEHFGGPGFLSREDGENRIIGGYYTWSGRTFYFSESKQAFEFKMRWM